jgi:drug/metabolite transporter (DMT)-like permease
VSAILLALGASVAWCTSDFLGGVAAREVRLVPVVAGSQLFGLVVFAPILMLHGTPMPSDPRLLLGLLAGLLSAAALGLIYFALRRGSSIVMATISSRSGPLSIVAVIASLYPVSTIALGMIALRERLSRIHLAGAALAGVGVAILAASTG